MTAVVTSYLPSFLVVVAFVHVAYVLALHLKRRDIADVMWGPGIALAAWSAYLTQESNPLLLAVLVCITLWACRLATHIGSRFFAKKEEDPRYARFTRPYSSVFLLQGFLMLVIATIVIAPLTFSTFERVDLILISVGFCLFFVGFFFESLGDYQLKRFLSLSHNKGKIMMSGLWNYTRHPNYFGEVSLWWGLWLVVCSFAPWYAIISPLAISFLILKVSGIPMLEKRYEGNDTFEAYKKRTNAFFPWFPKK